MAAGTYGAAHGAVLIILGLVTGVLIGGVASLLCVAGGELLIPTLILLFGLDIKAAGSMSLAVSLPTMLVGFARYSRNKGFAVLQANAPFVLSMALGSLAGAFLGAQFLGAVPAMLLVPVLVAELVLSAVKMWSLATRV